MRRIGIDVGGTNTDALMIGTTHFTNAVVERRGLTRVAAVRIGLPASASLVPFDVESMREAAAKIRDSEIRPVAVNFVTN